MSGVHDLARLQALLGADAWHWWRMRVRRELEAGRCIPEVITNRTPTAAEREAANRLLATPGSLGAVRIRSSELDGMLRDAGIANDLVSCLVALDGPLLDRVGQREADATVWQAVVGETEALLGPLCPLSNLREVLSSGLLRRLSANQPDGARLLLRQAAAVMTGMHARPGQHLAEVAAVTTGDAHALDRDRALGRLVLRLCGGDIDDGVLAWRNAWLTLGILVDAVSASTLVLNLPAQGSGRLARLCDTMSGEPMRITARQLESEDIAFAVQGRMVFVCENPTVVAATATALGIHSPPLVAVCGRATTPSLLLLRRLEQDGARLRYQGDGDWPGLAITAELRRHVRIESWRLTSHDLGLLGERKGPPLEGPRVETPWDPPLADALALRGRALHEEAILDLLLEDLTSSTRGS